MIKGMIGIVLNYLYFAIVIASVWANVNLSIIISILALTPFFTAFGFHFFFKEKLAPYHYYGMIFMTLCVGILTNSQPAPPSEETSKGEEKKYISIIVPVALALLLTLIVTFNNLTSRFIFRNGTLSSK